MARLPDDNEKRKLTFRASRVQRGEIQTSIASMSENKKYVIGEAGNHPASIKDESMLDSSYSEGN